MATLAFDAQSVDTSNNPYDPLPAGWYTCVARETDVKMTKERTGRYVYVDFEVAPGEAYAGRHIFARITVENQSETAMQIGHTQLAELCGGVGLLGLNDTDELLGKPVAVKVKIRRSEEYGDQNDVIGFRAAGAGAPGGAVAQPAGRAPATAPPAQGTERAPWAA